MEMHNTWKESTVVEKPVVAQVMTSTEPRPSAETFIAAWRTRKQVKDQLEEKYGEQGNFINSSRKWWIKSCWLLCLCWKRESLACKVLHSLLCKKRRKRKTSTQSFQEKRLVSFMQDLSSLEAVFFEVDDKMMISCESCVCFTLSCCCSKQQTSAWMRMHCSFITVKGGSLSQHKSSLNDEVLSQLKNVTD